MTTLRKYGRTIIAIVILVLSAVLGEVDLTSLEAFLTSIVEDGGVTVGALCALIAHYFGERWIGVFEPAPPTDDTSGAATMLLALMLPAGIATHAVTPQDLTGPAYSGETVTERLTDQTHAPGDVSLLKHRPL